MRPNLVGTMWLSWGLRGYSVLIILSCAFISESNDMLNIFRIQNMALDIYNRFSVNASFDALRCIMDRRLYENTNRLIDRIRGWTTNATGSISVNEREAIDYLHAVFVILCVEFADALYDNYCTRNGSADVEILLQASQIYQIHTTWQWSRIPSDSITRYEIQEFLRRGLTVNAISSPPYLQLSSTHNTSPRFYYEIANLVMPDFTHSYHKPTPGDPSLNLRDELGALKKIQGTIIYWFKHRDQFATTQPFFLLNEAFFNELQTVVENFSRHFNLNNTLFTMSGMPCIIISYVVLLRYIEFASAEYDRHCCHPAHLVYAHTQNSSVSKALSRNDASLRRAYHELQQQLEQWMSGENKQIMRAFYAHISNFPFRVVYVQYEQGSRTLKLRLVSVCREMRN